MIRKLGLLFLLLLLVSATAAPAVTAAEAGPTVLLNGQTLSFEVAPLIENGRTLVPFRAIFEALGATVAWDQDTQTATATRAGTMVVLPLNSTAPTVNGSIWPLDVPAKLVQDRILAPLRFVGEALGSTVTWDAVNNRVLITSEGQVTPPPTGSTFQQVIQKGNPAIVYLDVFDKDQNIIGSGSGIAIDTAGKVLTSYRLIEGAYSAHALLADGREVDVAAVLSYNVAKDLAVLQVNTANITALALGDSGTIADGQKIVVSGNPFGYDVLSVEGFIDQKSALKDGIALLKVQVPVSLGGTGSALLNYQAQVIGLITSRENKDAKVYYAVPINEVKPLLNQNLNQTLAQVADANRPPDSQPAKVRYMVTCTGLESPNEADFKFGNRFSVGIADVSALVVLNKPIDTTIYGLWCYDNPDKGTRDIFKMVTFDAQKNPGQDILISTIYKDGTAAVDRQYWFVVMVGSLTPGANSSEASVDFSYI